MNPAGPPTAFDSLNVAGVPTMGMAGIPPTTGCVFFVNPVGGSDGNTGVADHPFQSLYWAHAHCVDGRGDVVVLVGNGQSSGTARLSLAAAQAVNAAATSGVLNWTKNNTHLVGLGAPTMVGQRARIAPPTGTYTQATFGSGNFVVVTGSGCLFQNISLFHGFSTGGVNQICWTDNGSRNAYLGVDFGGMGDAASAADAGSRSLKIGLAGSGENTFRGCNIGLDTVARGVANANLEFAGGTPRNSFFDCNFPMDASAATVLSILCTGASAIDRWQRFDNALFLNAMSSGATAQTQIASMTSASPGGYLAMNNCGFVGNASTNWGDTNALANMYVLGATPLTASNGIMVTPS